MPRRNASLCDLPVELAALVFSHIEHVQTRQTLEAMSSTFQEASSLPGALPRTFDLEGVAGNLADQLVRLLDGDRVRSLEKERALELIGVYKDRLCEYACGRNFEVLKWAHNELDLPWAPYPAGRVDDDVLVLRVLRETNSELEAWWPEDEGPEEWDGVMTMKNDWVVKLGDNKLTSLPAEIGQLTSLETLSLIDNQLTNVPAAIRELRAAGCSVLLDDGVTVDV